MNIDVQLSRCSLKSFFSSEIEFEQTNLHTFNMNTSESIAETMLDYMNRCTDFAKN